MDDPDLISRLRKQVKEIVKYDNTEGFKKQREFMQGLFELTKEDKGEALIKGDGLHVLFPLLESTDVKTQASALSMIANLAQTKVEYAVRIVHEGGVDGIVPLTKSEVPQVQMCALGCIGNLIRDPNNAQLVAGHEGLLATLGQVLNTSNDPQVQKVAGNCLANFATHVELRPTFREERIHLALIKAAVSTDAPELLMPVGRCFAAMALDPESQVLIAQAGGLDTSLKLLRVPVPQIQQFAMMALINMAANTENADAVLMNAQCLAALNHICRTQTDQFQKMAQGVVAKLQASKNSVVGEDIE